MNKKLGVVTLFVGVPVLIVVVMSFFHERPKTWEQEGRVSSSRQALTNWASASFVALRPGEELMQQITNIPIQATNTQLSAVQVQALYDSAYKLAMAFHVGTYESYSAFRFPIKEGEFNKGLITFRVKLMQELKSDLAVSADNPEEACKAWWQFWKDRNDVNCTACVKELNLDKAKMYAEESSAPPAALNYFVTGFENNGYLQLHPCFTFRPSVKDMIAAAERVHFAVISFIVKMGDDPPHPIFCRFYWVPQYGTWLPSEFATAYPAHRKWTAIF